MSWLDILKDYVDTLEAAVGAIEGATTLHDKLTVARANLLDEITAARMGELDGANLPADIDALLTRLSATRAGYLDELDFDLTAAIAAIPTTMVGTNGAALAANWTAALATALAAYTAVRGGYLDELDFDLAAAIAAIPTTMVGTDNAALASVLEDAMQKATGPAYNQDTDSLEALRELLDTMVTSIAALQTDLDNPSQYKADLSTLETRLSATRAGYLDQLDFALQEAIAAIPTTMVGTNGAALASAWTAALATALAAYTAVRGGYLDELDFALQEAIAAIPTTMVGTNSAMLATSGARQLFTMDFWSDTQEELLINATAGDKSLPTVTVAELPTGATIVRAIAMFKFRMVENVYAGANAINVAQHIQVRDDTPGTFRDAISIADNLFNFSEAAREGGDILIGDHDIAVEVDANDGYNFQWTAADADQISINFNDIQVGLRIWYSV